MLHSAVSVVSILYLPVISYLWISFYFLFTGRTFPAHPYFMQTLGPGQLALFNVLKAYSLLDQEVGYCQGLSFVGGILLLHVSLLFLSSHTHTHTHLQTHSCTCARTHMHTHMFACTYRK